MALKGTVTAKAVSVKRRSFTRDFKLQIIREVESWQVPGSGRTRIPNHRKHHFQNGESNITDTMIGRSPAAVMLYTDEARLAELERWLAVWTMENDLLKKLLQKLNEAT